MKNKLYWIWLALAAGPASSFAPLLLAKYQSPEAIYSAKPDEITAFADEMGMKVPAGIFSRDLGRSEDILAYCEENGISLITPASKNYPPSLLRLMDMPVLLYCKGELPDLARKLAVAVVGTRKMTDHGRDAAYKIGTGLALGGACVVSGGALGIDGMALSGAISAGGRTVVVLGSGIDILYPSEHKRLFSEVLKNGAIITEYPPGTPPAGRNFPQRNRIISGISRATVVVEADMKSGSMITAKLALYQGSDLYAVPGNIDSPMSAGTNHLIKSGTRAVTCAEDVLKNYEYLYNTNAKFDPMHSSLGAEEAMEQFRIGVRVDKKTNYGRDNYGGKTKNTVKEDVITKRKKRRKALIEEISLSDSSSADEVRADDLTKGGAKSPRKRKLSDDDALARKTPIELGEDERAIYKSMVAGVPTLAEELHARNPKIRSGDLLASVTILELCGMIECGKGGYFLKVTEFDDEEYSSDNE